MKIDELLNLGILRLPLERPPGKDYYRFILDLLRDYTNKINDLENFQIAGRDSWMQTPNINLVQASVRQLFGAIRKAIKNYYDGRPHQAYMEFSRELSGGISPDKNFLFSKLREDEYLYRIRTSKPGRWLAPRDIFHIPMDKREIIGTRRFSIPGHPCLYLSNSTYLCWLELGNPELGRCNASLFRVENDPNGFEEIVLLDLSNIHPTLLKNLNKAEIKWDGKLLSFLSLWPLIAACSVRVQNKEGRFMPEYIIPQLLLQWIKEEFRPKASGSSAGFRVHGVKYSSTHLDMYSQNLEGIFYNLAIPIWSSTKEPYCNFLAKKFRFSQPLSWEQLGLLLPKASILNDAVPLSPKFNIELIKGQSSSYLQSQFGYMEKFLMEGDLIEINTKGAVVKV